MKTCASFNLGRYEMRLFVQDHDKNHQKQPREQLDKAHRARRYGNTRIASLPLLACAVMLAGLVLALAPQIDLAVAHLFYRSGHFIGDTTAGRLAREVGRTAPFFILLGLTLLWIAGKFGLARAIAPRGRSIAWLVLSMALGPGLLVDGLKEVSHRPRPIHLEDFGGTDEFRPFYRFDGACPRNCSFPSGEASAAFWTLVPASLAPPALRPVALAAAALFGLATGGLRMAFGGHFLSDVLFAAILTLAVALLLRRIRPLRDDGRQNLPGQPASRSEHI
jgi:lipid A 4'-phosphatase